MTGPVSAGSVSAGSVARLAGLLADRTRMTLLLALLDGRAWTMTELARHVGVAASTAASNCRRWWRAACWPRRSRAGIAICDWPISRWRG